ncbi:hypothetical protein P3X46_016848 [Hevea brasiliensis]|uniref:Protein phosphatase n=1 Tax=Hevea brasiliensis TaxID=3981 RepID=A0ABQ9M4A1_HEVBR|nr:probable protein phosphatase 2C 55 isoform X1 [Hevea brasiliensis]KAJ9173739.1 hypothetical protein P3X46_016848 [Hevea brasiliensis]
MASMNTEIDKAETVLDGASHGKGKLIMVSGSFYIAKGKHSKPQGEDAHFICVEKQTIAVADGVGGCSRKGIDAGIYARQLMENAVKILLNEPGDNVDLCTLLYEAYLKTRAQGSSTACIIALLDNSLRAVNVGDSGFMLIRKGEVIYQSPIQQHSFNYPYQLECDEVDRSPSYAEEFVIAVESGDVVIAGTDGLFDNLFATQIEEVARAGIQQGLDPQDVAWTIAQHAYHISR